MSARRQPLFAVLALCLVAGILPARAAPVAGDFDVAAAIAAARTPADQARIADYYDAEIARLTQQVALHRRMGHAYQSMTHAHHDEARVRAHCNGLIEAYEQALKLNQALAAEHRALATAPAPRTP